MRDRNPLDAGLRGRSLYGRLRPLLTLIERGVLVLPEGLGIRFLAAIRERNGLLARAIRFALMRRLAGGCGELVDIRESVHLHGLRGLQLGSRISIHPMCYLDASGGVSIGSDTSIAHAVTVMSTSHRFDDLTEPTRDQGVEIRPVVIGDNVWIGAGARVLGGVTIGSGSVVAAGAVVTQDVPCESVVAGVPARVVRQRRSR